MRFAFLPKMMLKFLMIVACLCWLAESDKKVGAPTQSDESQIKQFYPLLHQNLNSRPSQPNYAKLTKVLNVTKQLVAGMLYKFDFETVVTQCSIESLNTEQLKSSNLEECPVTDQIETCHAKVYERAWLKEVTLQSLDCHPPNN